MKLRKILSAVMASAVAVSAMAVTASAASYTATIGYADSTWAAQDWASSCEVTGDGTYSITTNCVFNVVDEETGEETQEPAAGTGAVVFVVDIAGLGKDLGIDGTDEVAKYDTGALKVTDVKVTTGGTEIALDQSKLKIGDIEGTGNVRIEIFNAYGPTAVAESYDPSVSPLDPSTVVFTAEDQLTVTFTLEGLDAPAAEEAPVEDTTTEEAPAAGAVDAETDSSKGSPDTGVEDVAVVAGLAIVAAGAVLVSKKRK